MSASCDMCGRTNNLLFETKHWNVILNIDQGYVARCLVIAKRHVANLPMLTPEEWTELHATTQRLEGAITKAFPEIDVLNWGCFMNHSFRKKPFNSHVHWHVFPRHEKPITFDGVTWTDAKFGEHYETGTKKILSGDELKPILMRIQKYT